MRGTKTGQDKRGVKDHDDLCGQDVICAGHMAMQKQGEIAVFDAGKYFAAGAGNRRSRIEDMEEELDEDADAEASGDLPLSPLPEFYTTSSKARHYTRVDQWQQGDKAYVYTGACVQNTKTTNGSGAIPSPAHRRMLTSVDPLRRMRNGDSIPSPPSVALSGRDHVNNEPRGSRPANITNSTSRPAPSQSKSSKAKPQPFSPSSRLASFLAKFKLSSSESKSKPSSQSSSAPAPTLTPNSKSFFSNASALPTSGKPPSPSGRFLRALSSSSSHTNSLLKPIPHMHHHSSIAASTPVSPAGSDPYSPITHSASTTPTSRKNPRSRSRSHVSHLEGTSPGSRPNLPATDWRRDLDNSSSRSLSTHLPFLRRKLKAYLMPEKSPRHPHEIHHQVMNKQEKVNIHHLSNGPAHADQDTLRHSDKTSTTSVSDKSQVANHLSEAFGDDRQRLAYKENAASMDNKARGAGYVSGAQTKAQLDQHHQYKPQQNSMRSPARRVVEPPTTQDTRRRGDWRRHAEDMEDDIEVAERLLRVVKEHQSSKTYTSSYKGTSNYRQQSKGGVHGAKGHGGEMNGSSSCRKGRKSLVSPSSSPAANYHSKQACKEEFACPYDSDSSSDLFEIETLQAFSHVAGLYRPRDLPVYDSNPLKSPLHLK